MKPSFSRMELLCISILSRNDKMTGYDICKYLNGNGVPDTHQLIYRTLNNLSGHGKKLSPSEATRPILMRTDVPQEGKPDKKVYSVNVGLDDLGWETSIQLLNEFEIVATRNSEMMDAWCEYFGEVVDAHLTELNELDELIAHDCPHVEKYMASAACHTRKFKLLMEAMEWADLRRARLDF